MEITEDLVRHMATLSRLELSDADVARFTKQLGDIINYASHLPELSEAQARDGLVMTGQDDVAQVRENPHGLLRNAVAFEEGFVKVPAILDKSES